MAPSATDSPPIGLPSAWRDWGRAAALASAATFAVFAVLAALDALNVTTPAPSIPDSALLPDRLLAVLENQSARFPWVLAATLVSILSFASLAALGPLLRRWLAPTEPRGWVASASFLLGGVLGIAGQLAFAGGQGVASDASYCQCDFADPQLIARAGVLDLVSRTQTWMLAGTLVAFGLGLVAVAASAAPLARGWGSLTRWLGVILFAVALANVGFPPLADALRLSLDPGQVTGVASLLVLLVLVPWWALWLRRLLAETPLA